MALIAPTLAAGETVEEGTRIAAQAGWRYAPNASFSKTARALETPLAHEPVGGPSLQLVFGYRVLASLEIAVELGLAYERFELEGLDAAGLTHAPLLIAARWYPAGRHTVTPYFGGGLGYFLNFFSGGLGTFESHTSGPFVVAGLRVGAGERVGLLAEARGAWATADLGSLGSLHVGGVSVLVGAELSFPQEKRTLDLR
ncbi:MAG: hypothetical protein ACOX6T_15535 [Myxococcales bacterium]